MILRLNEDKIKIKKFVHNDNDIQDSFSFVIEQLELFGIWYIIYFYIYTILNNNKLVRIYFL